jgi:Carboxypeptidase regulatory-like domain
MHHPMHHARVLRNPILLDRYGGCMKVAVRAVMAAFSIKVFCVAMVLTVTSTLSGQSFYGSIAGTVADADGALVPDATVNVANLGTSQVYTVKTNDAGEFSVVNFIPANYKVEVSKEIRRHGWELRDAMPGSRLSAGSLPAVFSPSKRLFSRNPAHRLSASSRSAFPLPTNISDFSCDVIAVERAPKLL